MENTLYFRDNFFSAGTTEIYNSAKEKVGELDLKSAFSSGVDVLDENGKVVVSGKFGFLSNKWHVTDGVDQEIGILRQRISFLSKKYEYEAYGRGIYEIESEAISRHYEIFDEQSRRAGVFEKVSGFFSSPAFQLQNETENLSSEELIAIVMGINAIQKRRRNANNAAAGS